MPGPNWPYTQLDFQQVLKQAFDETKDKIRVDAEVVASFGDAELAVELDAADGDNVALANADGSKKVSVTTSGSKNGLDVNVINSENAGTLSTVYNEVTSVSAASLVTVGGYTALGDSKLLKIAVSGTNIAAYQVELNASVIDKKRTYFGNSLNAEFGFGAGLNLVFGDSVLVKVLHNRSDLGDFNARIDIEE